jgi:hypothetical protein
VQRSVQCLKKRVAGNTYSKLLLVEPLSKFGNFQKKDIF